MKSLIVPIAVIVSLIILFVIVDYKEFTRHNAIQSIQAKDCAPDKSYPSDCQHISVIGGGTTKVKPTESKEPETHSLAQVDAVPVVEAKPTVSHSTAETRLVEMRPVVETKIDMPAETKPVAETKSVAEEKLAPAAIPVMTAEEAEKLNEDAKAYALAEKEKREPFYKYYQDTKLDSVCFQGTIRATSTIPNPEKNDYDNCLYALFIEIDAILSGVARDKKIPCEVILNVPIMKDKTILQDKVFLPGDKILCSCVEYDLMPQAIQEMQLSDDIQSFEHQQYYSIEINKITSFQEEGNRNFAKREITILPIQTLPKEEKSVALRKERIQAEIFRIEEEIKKHGGSFEKWKEEYKPIAEKYKKLCSEKYNGWLNDSFFAAGGSETTNYQTKEYINGILPYIKYLNMHNIDLIVVRVPSKWDFAARVLASDTFQENPAWVEHYYECLKNDIEIVDPMSELYNHRFDYTEFYYYQVPEEIHPYEGYAFVAAKVLSSRLKRYSFEKNLQQPLLKIENFHGSTRRMDYYPDGNNVFSSNTPMSFRSVFSNGSYLRCKDMSGSPFLIISNSLFYFPTRNRGAGFAEYLAYHLDSIPDYISQEGQYNSMLKSLVLNPTILSNRKAVIMPSGYFMWNGFPRFPSYLSEKPTSISLERTIDFHEKEDIVFDERIASIQDDTLTVETTPNSTFSLSFQLSSIPNKTNCMIRVIFKKFAPNSISVKNSKDNSIIEPECESDGFLHRNDLFVPMSNSARDISLHFNLRINSTGFQIDKIELWYY